MIETYRKNAEGIQLYYRSWPVAQPKAVIAMIHGQGDHIKRYDHVAKWMNDRGMAVYGFDQQGHGRSDGPRGHAASLEVLLNDIVAHVTQVQTEFPNTPVFVYAHSMGGQLALNCALKDMFQGKIAGMVATSPWVKLAFEPAFLKVVIGKLLRSILPGLTLPTGLASTAISRDKDVVDAYNNDPLVHGKVSASAGISLMEGAAFLDTFAGKVPFPMLILHGTADKLTSMPASKALASRLTGAVTYQAYEGFYHETHNEPEKEQVLGFISDWLKKHIKG
jgi:alpha-beta hydrolase superfamily lysophospholipase